MNKVAVLEGLLFVVGDEGLTLKQIEDIIDIDEEDAKSLLKELQKEYESDSRGIRISFLADTFKLTTKKEHLSYYQKLLSTPNSTLSQAALETLAVIAYNQPITRVKVDELRGISSAFLIKKLLARDLIKVSGKSELPGRPNLYKTTQEFLDYFGLASLDDLPKIMSSDKKDEEVDLYKSKYSESE